MKPLTSWVALAVTMIALLVGSGATGRTGAAETDEAIDPQLTLRSGEQVVVFKRSDLLKRSDIETIVVPRDPSYRRSITYRAVRTRALFEGLTIADDAVVQFRCLDGFSAPISKERLLDTTPGRSVAYIAIEEEDKPWPPLKPGRPSAGPFYLVWQRPEASFIGPEEWPYQLVAFEVKGTLESLYPRILPDARLGPNTAVRQGFAVFTKNCFACHTLNKAGESAVGPDLNVPMNPTEYLRRSALRAIVRDPQSLRHFPESRMSGFPEETLSEKDLDHLIAYLKHMARRKEQSGDGGKGGAGASSQEFP